ncbi:AraC family transcriptional regulator [Actinoplanes sp. NBRC 103695]|uniref:helix-turn-helix transcriptional regulator n=1 Tax=Actinoplanes sp. NBRC 103695 TaxID=3032202 RepID=UPI0024A1C344|nr:AraC family transcriptional regulator [Actinoplanes sp. NBRC 103695]GLY96962.1 transcriptional regulator [Actinoplanes sp. NBRC 103695]
MRRDRARRRFDIDINVDYADDRRDDTLRTAWRQQAGDLVPPPPLTLPRHSEGSYRVRIRRLGILDLVVEDQYSDAVAGRTGGSHGHLADRVVSHFTFRGEWRFGSARRSAVVGPGRAYIRRNDQPWDFEVDRGTHALMLSVPIEEAGPRARRSAVPADRDSPAARLLLAHIRSCLDLGDGVGAAARNATLELFRGLLDQQVIDDDHQSPALVAAARECIDRRLLTDPGLNPAAIATTLHVSVRTLHRAFAREGISVMGYVRQRRLERAGTELLSTTWTVSELAARWHFTDESHLIKAYRRHYGQTPAARRRTRPSPSAAG